MLNRFNNRGSILIFAVWALSLLTIFAVHIGLKIRQRATLLSRLEVRSQLHFVAESGVKKAISALKKDFQRNNSKMTPYGKLYRHNNADMFKQVAVGSGSFDISYPFWKDGLSEAQERFGLVDEESKLNINIAERSELIRLLRQVGTPEDEQARLIADAIIDWREAGQSRLDGFYSDNYYYTLEHPYEPKSAAFELIDELKLVQGISTEIFERLRPFITIYGDGRVNINTADFQVLKAIGLSDEVIEKILIVRRGYDEKEATVDDYIFDKSFDVVSGIRNFIELKGGQAKQIDQLNSLGKIKTESQVYSIQSLAQLEQRQQRLSIECVYNIRENSIEYWREKYQ